MEVELIDALEVELVGAALEPGHGIVEGEVARVRGHAVETEIGLDEGRQNPGQEDVAAAAPGGLADLAEQLPDLPLHGAEAGAAEDQGIEVELEVESRELGGEVGVVHRFEHLGGDGRRTPVGIDEKQLLFGPDASNIALEEIVVEHLLERTDIVQQVLEKDPYLFRLRLASDILFTHGLAPPETPRCNIVTQSHFPWPTPITVSSVVPISRSDLGFKNLLIS